MRCEERAHTRVRPFPVVLEENELPKEARETWAAGKPCLLITHGTSRPFEASFFGNSIAACLQLGYNGLVITPQPHTELITQQPSEIRWFEPRLLVSLLPHVDAIIHHGGIGTAAQALLAAKPQLIMGYGFDRLENAKLLQGIGAAEFLPHSEWQPTQIVTALRRLTNSSIVRTRCLELSRKMREENSLANAVAAIEATKTGANYIVSESFPGSYKKEQRPIFDGLSAERQELLVLRLKQKKLVKPRDRSLK